MSAIILRSRHTATRLSQVEEYHAKVKPQAGGSTSSSNPGTAGGGEENYRRR
ncbi:MAG: hypothetical protein R3D26_23025 [Cyanobacteriota/Melainabacteria group bacterium]